MQLSQSEAIRVEDEHHRRLGHVHSNFQHGRADQHVDFPVAEQVHPGIALRGLHLAVYHADAGHGLRGQP